MAVGAFVGLLRAHSSVTRELSARLQAEHGLTINEYEALLLLSRAQEQRMRPVDLAARLLLTPSGVTRLLDGLVRAGLVERAACASDRRVAYAVLSGPGKERLREASRSHIAAVDELFERRLEPDELADLSRLLGRLTGVADGDDACDDAA